MKGRLFPPDHLLSPKFRRALSGAVSEMGIDLRELSVKNIERLRRVLIDAHKRLGKAKVTATDWLGRVFEIIGPALPEVIAVEKAAISEFLRFVNQYVEQRKSGFTFMNGYYEMAGVKKPFTSIEVVYNVRIRRPGQAVGSDYVDRANLITNADGQKLFVSTEFKTRGAAGDLRRQQAERDERLFAVAMPEGTKLAYSIEGRTGTHETDFENLILLRDSQSPALPRAEDVFSKLGVRAGRRFRVTIAEDERGGKYIRVAVPVSTDVIRRLLERLLRDKSWQKAP